MMHRLLFSVLLFLAGMPVLFAQETVDEAPLEKPAEEEKEFIFRPTIGLGVGMMTYYGDISKGSATNNPIISQLGYELRVTQSLNDFLDLSFYMSRGKISANERSIEKNRNFESTLTTGGMALAYNFDHLLPEDRTIDPYISLGIESVEFLSKTDLIDEFGNPYYYWSDGKIRNLPEGSENAIIIQRDYEYESDIRELNVDGLPAYDERTWAIPIGAGVNFHVSNRVKFRIGTALHYSFSDNIDGITDQSLGSRKGDPANDMWLFSSFNLNYNLTGKGKDDEPIDDPLDGFISDQGDEDNDGVIDLEDACPRTPEGAEVDEKGCPLDEDSDNRANYYDQELGSAPDAFVDENGVTLSEEDHQMRIDRYFDTTGAFVTILDSTYAIEEGLRRTNRKKEEYIVEFDGNTKIDPELAEKMLNDPNFVSRQDGDRVIIGVGNIDNFEDAKKIYEDLKRGGFPVETVTNIDKSPKGKATKLLIDPSVGLDGKPSKYVPGGGEVNYRLQIGAYSKEVDPSVFEGLTNVVPAPSSDGLVRYYSGSYSSYSEAAAGKIELLDRFPGAFVVPFQNAKRVTLSEIGASTPAPGFTPGAATKTDPSVKFRVQIGSYQNQLPNEVLERFMELGNIERRDGPNGSTRYFAGEFDTYEEAANFKNQLRDSGLDDAFVAGEHNGKIISSQEAIQILQK